MRKILIVLVTVLLCGMFAGPVMAVEGVECYEMYDEYRHIMEGSKAQLEALESQLKIINDYICQKHGEGRDITMCEYRYMIYLASRCNVELSDIFATIDLESGFDRDLVGAAGEMGWMQIMPETAQWVLLEHGYRLGLYGEDVCRVKDPIVNLKIGVLFKWVLQQDQAYAGDKHAFLTAYNRGPYSAAKYYKENQTYRSAYSRAVVSREEEYSDVVELNNIEIQQYK